MFANYSDNAVLAKARSMYGKRLTVGDYNFLLECNSVSDIADYLKRKPRYENILASLSDNEIHRGKLEETLKIRFYGECATLCRYEITTLSSYFYKYIIGRAEIEYIMHFLILLSAHRTDEYIYNIPLYLDKHSQTDIHALVDVKSYDDFLRVMKKTPYYNIFKKYEPHDEQIDLPSIENELYISLYRELFDIIDKQTHGKEKKELSEIFNSHINLINFDRILRMKKYYKLDSDQIEDKLLPFGTLTKKQLGAMLSAGTSREIFSIMEGTHSGKRFKDLSYAYTGEIPDRVLIKNCKKQIRFSLYPSIVMLSYLFISEREMKNLISIIEGVRYNISPDTIKSILIL